MGNDTISGSIFSPLLFNIYINDIFMILKTTYFTDYAVDSMHFVVGDHTTDALKALEQIGKDL